MCTFSLTLTNLHLPPRTPRSPLRDIAIREIDWSPSSVSQELSHSGICIRAWRPSMDGKPCTSTWSEIYSCTLDYLHLTLKCALTRLLSLIISSLSFPEVVLVICYLRRISWAIICLPYHFPRVLGTCDGLMQVGRRPLHNLLRDLDPLCECAV